MDQQAADPHFWEKVIGGVAGLLIGGGAAVRKLSKKASDRARATEVDWHALVEALERNTAAVEKLTESNREEHEKTRHEQREARERLGDLMTRVLTR